MTEFVYDLSGKEWSIEIVDGVNERGSYKHVRLISFLGGLQLMIEKRIDDSCDLTSVGLRMVGCAVLAELGRGVVDLERIELEVIWEDYEKGEYCENLNCYISRACRREFGLDKGQVEVSPDYVYFDVEGTEKDGVSVAGDVQVYQIKDGRGGCRFLSSERERIERAIEEGVDYENTVILLERSRAGVEG